jgi:hypothetical protein
MPWDGEAAFVHEPRLRALGFEWLSAMACAPGRGAHWRSGLPRPPRPEDGEEASYGGANVSARANDARVANAQEYRHLDGLEFNQGAGHQPSSWDAKLANAEWRGWWRIEP